MATKLFKHLTLVEYGVDAVNQIADKVKEIERNEGPDRDGSGLDRNRSRR